MSHLTFGRWTAPIGEGRDMYEHALGMSRRWDAYCAAIPVEPFFPE